ncbi:ATP-binding protein [Indioceanicola profundi]|uniref:ATP-binding protein n=1 Tax=Indioceanicola profundi TaxID=2220096 RepID=UPI000E6AB7AC|nr:ATP-binding protein [Indioceanicola profundi]
MSLRARVVLIVMALAAAAALAGFAAVVVNARVAVRAETLAALDAAEFAVRELARAGAVTDAEALARMLGPRELRHVHVVLPGEIARLSRPRGHDAPDWFVRIVWDGEPARTVPVAGGVVILEPDPRDELAEAWSDAVALAWIAGAALILLLAAVHLAVSRALAPLASFNRALDALSRGERDVDPSTAAVPELAGIGGRIRALDAALSTARRENAELSRVLLDIQDRERRELAREVHDELGPLLFGIRVDAHAISRAAQTGALDGAEASGRADAIAAAAGQIRDISRRILGRLRPMALDHLDLSDVLLDLIDAQRRQHPDIAFSLEVAPGLEGLGEAVDLTVYRIVQEGVLNALRHGHATRVAVTVAPTGPEELAVTVADNGSGFHEGSPLGHGIAGMRERVQALGGELRIGPGTAGGTLVAARLPASTVTNLQEIAG